MLNVIRFSYFQRANETTAAKEITLRELADLITKDQNIVNDTNLLRQAKSSLNLTNKEDKAKYQKHKLENLSGFTPAGVFLTRASSECVLYTQLVHMDLDGIDAATLLNIMNALKARTGIFKTSLFAFISPSGNGIKIFHAVKSSKPIDAHNAQEFHKQAFDSLYNDYLAYDGTLKAYLDRGISDLARLCYICHDPNFLLFDQDFTAYQIDETKFFDTIDRHNQFVKVYNMYNDNFKVDADYPSKIAVLDELYTYCEKNGKSITTSYANWFRVLFALKRELHDSDAYEYAKKFSKLDASYNDTEFNTKFNSMKKMKYDIAPGIATILFYAKAIGFKSRLNNEITQRSKFTSLIHALAKNNIQTRYNTMSCELEIVNREIGKKYEKLTDAELDYLYTTVNNQMLTKSDLESFLVATSPKYNPVEQFLSSIPAWDGKDHIESIVKTLNPEKYVYAKTVIYQWCLLFFAQLTLKERNPYVVILQGPQGCGKTTWIDNIFKPLFTGELTEYYLTKCLDFNSKDDLLLLAQKFLVFNDELQNVISRKADIDKIKGVLSSDSVTLRKAFGRYNQNYTRRASMIGTVNASEIIRDDTGARRFLILPVQEIDFLKIINNRDQVLQFWAQIYHDFQNGASLYFPKELEKEIEHENKKYEVMTLEDGVVLQYIEPANYERNGDWKTPLELYNLLPNNSKLDFTTFSRKLTKYFGDKDLKLKKSVARHGKTMWCYNLTVKSASAHQEFQKAHDFFHNVN